MKKKIILLFLSGFFWACGGSEKPVASEDILSVQKMTEVQTDMQLLEAALNLNVKQTGKPLEENANLVLEVFDKHEITEKQYQVSMKYYMEHLDSLSKIYEMVLTELSKMQSEKDSVTPGDTVVDPETLRRRLLPH